MPRMVTFMETSEISDQVAVNADMVMWITGSPDAQETWIYFDHIGDHPGLCVEGNFTEVRHKIQGSH